MRKLLAGLVAVSVLVGVGIFVLRHSGIDLLGGGRSKDAQVTQSFRRVQEVVLLSLRIEGIAEESVKSKLFGLEVPGSGKTLFLQYGYSARLGVDGTQVVVEQTGDKAYRVKVPKFVFLGHSDVEFKKVVEDNGVISFATPDVDVTGLVNEILDDDAKQQLLADNRNVLREQCATFYEGIIHSVDPENQVDFVFEDPRSLSRP